MFNVQIPDGYPGTAETIRQMHHLVKLAVAGIGPRGERDDRIVRLARQIVLGLPGKDYMAEAAAILAWCQAHLRYVRDPWTPDGIERLQHPAVTIFETGSGDCDELAPVFSALCAAIGAPWAFRSVGQELLFPGKMVHVYSLVHVGGRWLAADPTFVGAPLGWEPPDADPRINAGAPAGGIGVFSRQDWPAT